MSHADSADEIVQTILIVDDNPVNLGVVVEHLEDHGFDIAVAQGGEEAIGRAEFVRPDLILLDIMMPGIDGFETCRRLKDKDETRDIPVIFMTALADVNDKVAAFAAGGVDYVGKPFQIEELLARVKMHLELRRIQRTLLDQNRELHEEIDARRAAETALRSSELRYGRLFEDATDAIALIDPETGRVDEANPAFLAMLGYDRADLLGRRDWDELWPDETRQSLRSAVARAMKGSTDRFSAFCPTVTKQPKWCDFVVTPIKTDEGEVAQILAIARDVTEVRDLEDSIRHAQKMEVVGQLTGGLAHDFNNLLAVIIGNLDLVEEDLTDETLAEPVREAIAAALRGRDLNQQLLAFSRRQALAPVSVNINELVSTTGKLSARTLGGSVDVQLQLSDALWSAKVDPAQLESAILNLLINGRDAMPNGGAIVIETANQTVGPEQRLSRGLDLSPGTYVVITVTDTGEGMSPETLERAFEPFYTTKGVGAGSGLGLSMVYGFVRQSGGQVRIRSEVGHGTSVQLYLPQCRDSITDQSVDDEAEALCRGKGETILLVEDDDAVRKVTARQLEQLGYRVVIASSGAEALAAMDEHPKLDLLFTDVVMPGGMNGFELSQEATNRSPGLKVLHASGYTDSLELPVRPNGETVSLLPKPYRKWEMAAKVREIIDCAA
ncbi:response regulator [Sphingosinicella terrae]|uniref:response regulator n=1 Tax=Sphingosinicella terrae TaxID=2172047 RepID=UPI0013B3CCE6|nr:response regulator [Sphingosinicella terrae]